jgi:hypothetical protein
MGLRTYTCFFYNAERFFKNSIAEKMCMKNQSFVGLEYLSCPKLQVAKARKVPSNQQASDWGINAVSKGQ